MSNETTKRILSQAGAAVRRLNPEVFGPVVDSAPSKVLQPNVGPSLVGPAPKPKVGRTGGLAGVQRRTNRPVLRVTILALSRRILDLDNLMSGTKAIRDAIAREFGLDDNESQINWQYASVPTRGEPGVVVKIEPA